MVTTATEIETYKEMVRQEWTDPATVRAWTKWAIPQSIQTGALTEAIVDLAATRPGLTILDLASGTGEPALTLARSVGTTGHVTATDLSAGMLAAAEERARDLDLRNISFQTVDAHALPFGDGSFDRVTCRFGAMYFADAPRAMREIWRVLRPSGRVALVTWGPFDQNPFLTSTLIPFFKRVDVPPPPSGAPTPFKYANPDVLEAELRVAGFTDVQAESRTVPFPWPGPAEELWQHFYEVGAPFRPIVDGLPEKQRAEAIGEVLAGLRQYEHDGRIAMTAAVVVASGVRA